MVYFFGFWKGARTNRNAGRTDDNFIRQISFLFKEVKCSIEGTGTSISIFSFLSDNLKLILAINKLSAF
jgi:hypothetical protein